jgi:hypothetical protein
MLVLLTGPVGAAAAALSTALFVLGGAAYLKKKTAGGAGTLSAPFFSFGNY